MLAHPAIRASAAVATINLTVIFPPFIHDRHDHYRPRLQHIVRHLVPQHIANDPTEDDGDGTAYRHCSAFGLRPRLHHWITPTSSWVVAACMASSRRCRLPVAEADRAIHASALAMTRATS